MARVHTLSGRPILLVSKCSCCTQRITSEDEGFFNELCEVCYDSAGAENEHTDTNGEHNPIGCPTCANVHCMHAAGV